MQISQCLIINYSHMLQIAYVFVCQLAWRDKYKPLKRQTKIAADAILIFYFYLSKKKKT